MKGPDLDQQIRTQLNGYDHDAAGQIDDLTGAIRAVLDLHQPGEPWAYDECAVCSGPELDSPVLYPCPTIEIIAEHLIPTAGDQA